MRIVRWFAANIGYLLLAFLLALVVWFSAVVQADPNEERSFTRTLEVVGQNEKLLLVSSGATSSLPEQVRITLQAPRSVLDELANTPTLLNAWIDVTGLEAGKHTATVQVRWDTSPARLLRIEPAQVEVVYEAYANRTLPVTLVIEGDTAMGYQKGTATLSPSEAIISGRQSQVEKVAQLRAVLDVSGTGETIQTNLPILAVDENGNSVNDITINPKFSTVTQPISLLGGYKNVVVKVVTGGQIADGYRLTNLSVAPMNVTVFSADPQRINQIPGYVETEPVDLSNVSEDSEIRVKLVLPDGVTLVGEQSVLVQVSVAAIEGSLTVAVPVESLGLHPELQADFSPFMVDILVFGPLPVLENLTPDSFRVVVDLTGLEPGIYVLPIVIDLSPNDVRVDAINPETVEVTISIVPTPTPSPP